MSKEVHAVFMLLGPASRLSKGKVRLRFVDRLINKDTEEEKKRESCISSGRVF